MNIPNPPAVNASLRPRGRYTRVVVCGLLSLVALLCVAAPARAEDWPAWRHDQNRSATSSEKLALPLQQAWVYKSRQLRAAPNPAPQHYPAICKFTLPISAAGDSLFFTSGVDGRIVCLNAENGAVRWEYLAGSGVNRVPTVHNGKVYAGSNDGNVYCLNEIGRASCRERV